MRRLLFLLIFTQLSLIQFGQIIADHTVVDYYDQIPQEYIDKVKKMLVNIGGMSHGMGYINGVALLELYDNKFQVMTYTSDPAPPYSDQYLRLGRPVMMGETFYTSQTTIDALQSYILTNQYNSGNPFNVFGFGWSYQGTWVNSPGGSIDPVFNIHWAGSSEGGPDGNTIWGIDRGDSILTGNRVSMDTYLDAMEQYIQYCNAHNYPTIMLFTNGVVDSNSGTESGFQRELKNQHIREYIAGKAGYYFFDYADILIHNNSGEHYTAIWNDGGTLRAHDQIHPDNLKDYDDSWNIIAYTDSDGDHIGEVGALRLGKAMWWMLARMEGWDGVTNNIPVTGITVTGAGGLSTITTNNGTLQLSAAILPLNATNQTVTWSLVNGTGQATINATGLVTAVSDGTVTARATANDGSGIYGTIVITISNQVIPVTGIVVTGAGGSTAITTDDGTLQLGAAIAPINATNQTVTWSLVNGTGQATINATGLVTAVSDGTVTARATANDGSGIYGTIVITISNQVIPVTGIVVTGAGGSTAITTDDGTLQLGAAIAPTNATNQTVTWSLVNGTGQATINATGLVTAVSDGTVTARATANDGSGIYGTIVITISNQVIPVTGIVVTGAGGSTAITTDDGTLQLGAAIAPINATNQTVTWSLVNGTGQATINATGLVTAVSDGTVTARATANDGSGIYGTIVITISNQVIPVTGIVVTGAGGSTAITTDDGTLQLGAAIAPINATNQTVTWSLVNGTGQATISSTGLVTAITNGTVAARATANDGSGVYGELIITISNQVIPVVTGQIIADHTVVDNYDKIPLEYINEVKKMLLITAGETHNQAYWQGLLTLNSLNPVYKVAFASAEGPHPYTDQNLRTTRAMWGDYSNVTGWIHYYGEEDWFTNTTAISRTKAGITYCNTNGLTISALGFVWGYDAIEGTSTSSADPVYGVHWSGTSVNGPEGDRPWGIDASDNSITGNSVNMDTYLSVTQAYIDYCTANNIPTKVFFTTGPVDYYTGEAGYQGYLKYEHIRDYVRSNQSRILFDYADILSYDEGGIGSTTTWSGHTYPIISPLNATPLTTGYISTAGSIRLAKAMWWMLARMAGWDGTIPNIPVTGITVTGAGGLSTITTNNGTLQLSAAILPLNATNQSVTWSIVNGTGQATIDTTGLVTAESNGTVTARAISNDGSGVFGVLTITISNQVIPVAGITVTGAGGLSTITTNNGTLQLSAAILPLNATNQSVTWSIVNGTGQATIDTTGLVTAESNGTVTARAISNDGSGVFGVLTITISNQVIPVAGITVTGAGGLSTITTNNGTLQLSAAILPLNATNQSVTWSIVNGTGHATIDTTGLVTAESNGTVTARAISNDGSGVFGVLTITISNQVIPVTGITVTGAGGLSTITTNKGTLQLSAAILPLNATNQSVTWSIVNGAGQATIDTTGLVTAESNGTVTARAISNDGSGVFGVLTITISNQVIPVTGITVTGAGGLSTITTNNGTLQLSAAILPLNATNQSVTWSIVNGAGQATIDTTGLVTAESNGTVTARAISNDGSGVFGVLTITISNQVIPVFTGQIIADHTVVDLYDKIPQQYIDEVKKMLLITAGESHSQGYWQGLLTLYSLYPSYKVAFASAEGPHPYTYQNLRVSRATWGDYSNSTGWINSYGEEDWFTNATAVSRTKAGISYNNTQGLTISAMGFVWGYDAIEGTSTSSADPVYGVHWSGTSVNGPEGDRPWGIDASDNSITGNSVNMDTYLSVTQAYIDYCTANNIPTKVFFTTGPVDYYTGEAGYQGYLKYEHIRDYVRSNQSRILFDYADILSYDEGGIGSTTTWSGHTYPIISPLNATPLTTGYISTAGSIRLAKAMWWMLARMAGWDGTIPNIPVTGITVTGAGGLSTITTNNGTLQLSAAILPLNATNQSVTWSIVNGAGQATIDTTGLVTAESNGTVTARAISNDGSGVFGVLTITISNQVIPVTGITVTGAGGLSTITTNNGTLQLSAAILPLNATNQSVTWSIVNGAGQATIDTTGLVTAESNGTVTARAISNDGSGVFGVLTITISNQVIPVTGITVTGAGGLSTITTNNGTLQLSAAILPLNATNQSVTWSIVNGTGQATIDTTGLVTAESNGTVTARAISNDGSGVFGVLTITISNQVIPVFTGQIIADHTVVDLYDKIPQQYIDEVKKMLLITAGESHSQGYWQGLLTLYSLYPSYKVAFASAEGPHPYTYQNLRVSRATWGDYSNSTGWINSYGEEDWFTNATAVSRTKAGISYNNTQGLTISAMGFVWGYDAIEGTSTSSADPVYGVHWSGTSVNGPEGDRPWGIDASDNSITGNSVNMDTYLSVTQAYIDYCTANNIPTKVFFTTGPVDYYTGEAGYQGYLKYEHIRDYVRSNQSRILFDYADILSYDEGGIGSTTTWSGHTYPIISPLNATPLTTGYISTAGSIRLAKAMWWMLARMAGWDGTIPNIPVTGITVTGAGGLSTITTNNGTLQLSAAILPLNATNQSVTWSIVNGAGQATIDTTGLVTAESNGTVTARAISNDGSGVFGVLTITISNQVIPVTGITVTGAGGLSTITTNNGTLQLSAAILPLNATNQSVTWSIVNGTGQATIDTTGLVTAESNGTVTARAISNDGSGVFGVLTITISNQVIPVFTGQIIADHTVVDLYDKIPQQYIDEVKKMLLILAGESHSQGYWQGLLTLYSSYPSYKVAFASVGAPHPYTDQNLRVSRATWGDYSNSTGWINSYGEEDWFTNSTAVSRTKAGISYNNTQGLTISALGFVWGYDALEGISTSSADPVYGVHWKGTSVNGPEGDRPWGIDASDNSITGNSVNMDTYLSVTQAYIDYCTANNIPTKVFFTTGPVDYYTGEAGYQGYLKYEHIRDYVRSDQSRILFDYADILCYDEGGLGSTTTWSSHTYPIISPLNATPLTTGYISTAGSIRLAKAMWWMLARMAGWDGSTTKGTTIEKLKEQSGTDINYKEELLPELRIIAYPNPTDGYMIIESTLTEEDKYTIDLINVSGQIILNKRIAIIGGIYRLDLSDVKSGFYMLRIKTNKTTTFIRVIKE